MQAHLTEDRLHHLDASPAIACVEHDRRDAVGTQHVGERLHSDLRLSHMVQHPGRDDQIEVLFERRCLFDRKQVQLKVFQRVLVLEVLRMIQRGLADIDRHHLRCPVGVGEDCGLISATARDQNIEV